VSPKHLYIAIAVLAVALVGGLALHAYISASLATARADQVKADMKPIHEEATQQKESASKAEDKNQSALAIALATITAQKQQPIKTEVDYDRIEQMIAARLGVKAVVQPTALPDSPSATLPAKQLRDYISDCDETNARYSACKVTVENLNKQLDAETRDHQATKNELTAERKARKGTFWGRLKSNAQWLVIGGGVAGAALCGTGHCR
jgi:hypothetical protein